MYNQSINSTSINTCVMQSTIETRVVKVGDFVIIKEEYILYKGIDRILGLVTSLVS